MRIVPALIVLAFVTATGGALPTTSTESFPSILQQVRIGNTSVAPDAAMTPPIALVYPSPIYTTAALQAGIEGVVTVRAEFDTDGNFEVLEIVKGLGFGLDEAALAALDTWQFRPAYRAGRRVRSVANVDVEFHLPRALSVGGGVTMPRPTERVEPEYSEEARNAGFEGSVVLAAIVRKDGTVEIQRVVRGLGYGLDKNAIDALRQWKFRPAMRNGEAVDVSVNIEVNFNLKR